MANYTSTHSGTEIDAAVTKVEQATQAGSVGIDASPTEGSNNLVKSGGVYAAIQAGGSGDAVKYTAQSLTDNQKAQARTNIGAVAQGSQNNILATASVS